MGSYCPKRLNGMEKGHIGQMDHRAYFQYSKSFISSHTWELEHTQAGGRPKTFPQKTLFHLTTPFASSIGIADFKVHFPPWLFERISLKSHNPLSEFCPSASWTSLSDSHGVFVHCCQHPRWCLRSLILSALLDVHWFFTLHHDPWAESFTGGAGGEDAESGRSGTLSKVALEPGLESRPVFQRWSAWCYSILSYSEHSYKSLRNIITVYIYVSEYQILALWVWIVLGPFHYGTSLIFISISLISISVSLNLHPHLHPHLLISLTCPCLYFYLHFYLSIKTPVHYCIWSQCCFSHEKRRGWHSKSTGELHLVSRVWCNGGGLAMSVREF